MAVGAALHLEALRRGLEQAQADIARGSLGLGAVFESDDSTLQYLYVVKAVESVPGIGKVRARAILAQVGVEEHAHCGDLDLSSRREILQQIGGPK
jgi:hypothetical protein